MQDEQITSFILRYNVNAIRQVVCGFSCGLISHLIRHGTRSVKLPFTYNNTSKESLQFRNKSLRPLAVTLSL